MGRWEELDKKRAVQSGTGPGEFGPDYSDRKKYQLGHGNESPSPALKEVLDSLHKLHDSVNMWKERKKDFE